ncbi:MAG: phosphate:Na+ symporter [Polyangiales bacterium]|jgi:phosphate:Na+ symporter
MSLAHSITTFLGGIGFFLLGMHLMTDGLKVAAGGALERILRGATGTPIRAFGAGAFLTALVQSSSAVTIAALGFVNAGFLGLSGAVWVVFGSNVGTTATGWLVTLTGMDFDIKSVALPVVGIGTLLTLSGASKRRGAIGSTLTGLGLLFVGLGVLSDAFGTLSEQVDLSALQTTGPLGGGLLLLVGVLLTVVMQSSSAAIAITLTAAASEVVDLPGAALMVIGANVGTTSTALFATLKATPEAKRVAAAHVIFNVVAGVSAFVLLPVLLRIVTSIQSTMEGTTVTTTLALFHTAFNLLGVLLMWPLSGAMVKRLRLRFVTAAEEEGTPRYLDRTTLQMPRVALRALTRETARLGSLAGRILQAGVNGDDEARASLQEAFDRLLVAITEYVDAVDPANRSGDVSVGLRQLLRATRHYVIVTEQAAELRGFETGDLKLAAESLLILADPLGGFDVDKAGESFGILQERYDHDRELLLGGVTNATLSAREAVERQLQLTELRRAAKHLVRGARDLAPLRSLVGQGEAEATPEDEKP